MTSRTFFRRLLPLLTALMLFLSLPAQAAMLPPLHYIGTEAFLGCTALMGELPLPDGLLYIGERAFDGCSGLTGTLVLPDTVRYIGSRAFADTGFTGVVVIPASVTYLAADAFEGVQVELFLEAGSPLLPLTE